MHACMREAWVCVRLWMCTYVCARACHMCACNCNVSVCHVFDCSSIFIFYCKYNKKNWRMIGAWFFTIFSLPDTHTGSLSGCKTKCKTNVLTFMLRLMTAGESWYAQVFFKELSQLLSTLGLLWTIFFGQDDLLSLSLSLFLCLSVCLCVCLSVCLSLSLSLSLSVSVYLSLTQTLSQSLSLSLTCPWFSLEEVASVCMFAKTLVRTAIPEQ